MADPEFDPVEIVRALERHEVAYVIVGALAARLAGAPVVTADLDIAPAHNPGNIAALAAALAELGATFRIGSVEIGEPVSEELLAANDHVQTSTRHGDLDIVFRPAGTQGYEDLIRRATREEVAEALMASVATLADVIRSKEAAGRLKDRGQLPLLRETLERRRER